MVHVPALSSSWPNDAMYEILLRVPAKAICRFRCVCRAWRSLFSSQQFIAAHLARHQCWCVIDGCSIGTVIDNYRAEADGVLFEIVALNGDVVRRVRVGRYAFLRFVSLDFVGIFQSTPFIHNRVFNLTTGAVVELPVELAQEHASHTLGRDYYPYSYALGQVASTGEYKVIRILDNDGDNYMDHPQLCEVFTIDGSNNNARWRGKSAPPFFLDRDAVAVNGAVYFICDEELLENIASFDLEREDWTPCLKGPNQHLRTCDVSIAHVNGSIVLAHRCRSSSSADLWFLENLETGLWVKKYSMRAQLLETALKICPLVVLHDGRIALVQIERERGFLMIYNPKTNTFENTAEMRGDSDSIGLYSGSLLSLPNHRVI